MLDKRKLMQLQASFYLLAVSEFGGKRKASVALGVAIDTLTKYIDDLEKDLGIVLLVNDGRGSVLSAKAIEYIQEIKKIENEYADVTTPKLDDYSGPVNVGMRFGMRFLVQGKNIKDFLNIYPNIQLNSYFISRFSNLEDLAIDIGLDYDPPLSVDMEILEEFDIDCQFYASGSYIERYGHPKDLADLLENHKLLNKINLDNQNKEWKKIIKKAKHICYQSNNILFIKEMLRGGVGIGLMPVYYKDEGFVDLNILNPNQVKLHFYLYVNKKTKNTNRIKVFTEFYKKLIESSLE